MSILKNYRVSYKTNTGRATSTTINGSMAYKLLVITNHDLYMELKECKSLYGDDKYFSEIRSLVGSVLQDWVNKNGPYFDSPNAKLFMENALLDYLIKYKDL